MDSHANEHETRFASRWKRLGAQLIDAVIFFVVAVPALLLVACLMFAEGWSFERALDSSMGEWLVLLLTPGAVYLSLNGYLLARRGQTIGKLACDVQITDSEGYVPGPAIVIGLRSLVPILAVLIPYAGPLLVAADPLFIFGPNRRCLHDYVAGTYVMEGALARRRRSTGPDAVRCRKRRRTVAKAALRPGPPRRGSTVVTDRASGSSRDRQR